MENISYNIAVASDHRGYNIKSDIIQILENLGHKVKDLGPDSEDSVDYPDYAHKLTDNLTEGFSKIGILICGTGIGMSIAANRNSEIRAALCTSSEMARLSRAHNNANILVIGATLSTKEEIQEMVKTFLSTSFDGGRHTQRLSKIR